MCIIRTDTVHYLEILKCSNGVRFGNRECADNALLLKMTIIIKF